MKTFIAAIITALISINAYSVSSHYDPNPPQKICFIIDRNAHDSKWTRRDSSANLTIITKYGRTVDGKKQVQWNTNRQWYHIEYNKPPVCTEVRVPKNRSYTNWEFLGEVGIDVQWGGNCYFKYSRDKTVNVTIHHRKGDLFNPWSCAIH